MDEGKICTLFARIKHYIARPDGAAMCRDAENKHSQETITNRTRSAATASSGAFSDAAASGSSKNASGHGRKAAPEGPQTTGETRGLGSNRQSFHPPPTSAQHFRREMSADQRMASSIYFREYRRLEASGASLKVLGNLPARGVGGCGHTQIAGLETKLQRRTPKPDQFKAFMVGLQPCGLRHVCPYCTAKKAERDRSAVNAGLAAARAKGLFPVMLTLTTRHSRKDDPTQLLDAIATAERRLKNQKVWTRLPYAGYARVLEWTYGIGGHHPHYHSIILMRADSEAAAVEAVKGLQQAYMTQLTKAGRDGVSPAAWKHSFQVQGAAKAAAYITKWGLAEELTGSQKKQGKGEGLTTWEMLRLARTSQATGKLNAEQARAFYASRWYEAMIALMGRPQLFKSQGFKELVAEFQAENPPEAVPDPETVLEFGTREKGQPSTFLWERAQLSILAMKETAERVADLQDASRTVRDALLSQTLPTDQELLGEDLAVEDLGEVIENFTDDSHHTGEDVKPTTSTQNKSSGQDSRRVSNDRQNSTRKTEGRDASRTEKRTNEGFG